MTSQRDNNEEAQSRIQDLEAEVARLQSENDALCDSEASLAAERNKFADLYDFAPVGYVILSSQSIIEDANLFAAELVGLERRKFLGLKFSEFVHPDHLSEFNSFLEQSNDSDAPQTCELKLISDAKKPMYVALQKRHVQVRNNEVHIYLTILDITSRKMIEAERGQLLEDIRINEERFRMALENSSITIFNQDRDLRYTWLYNPVVLSGPEDFLGKTDHDLWPSDQADMLTELKRKVIDSGVEVRTEIEFVLQSGATLFFDMHMAPSRGPRGNVNGLIGVSIDLTAQKETDLEISRQRVLAESLASAVNAVHGSINLSEMLDFILSSMANVIPHDLADVLLIDGDFVRVERSRGYSQLQLDKNALPIEKPLQEIALLRQIQETQEAVLVPDLRESNGEEPVVAVERLRSFVGSPLIWQEEVIGFINLTSLEPDFYTSQHAEKLKVFAQQASLAILNVQLYEQAQEAAVLQERQRLARDLHDAVSQSLYTSNVIAESLLVMLENQPEKVPGNLERLRVINRGAIAEMRNLLLELRPEKLSATALEDLLQQIVEAARARAELEIDLAVESDEGIPNHVKEALYRVAQEAVTNIIKHARASHIDIRISNDGGQVMLTVEDDGRGFDPQSNATHRMGISNMQERMAAVHGHVEFDSEVGGGTVVRATWSVS